MKKNSFWKLVRESLRVAFFGREVPEIIKATEKHDVYFVSEGFSNKEWRIIRRFSIIIITIVLVMLAGLAVMVIESEPTGIPSNFFAGGNASYYTNRDGVVNLTCEGKCAVIGVWNGLDGEHKVVGVTYFPSGSSDVDLFSETGDIYVSDSICQAIAYAVLVSYRYEQASSVLNVYWADAESKTGLGVNMPLSQYEEYRQEYVSIESGAFPACDRG